MTEHFNSIEPARANGIADPEIEGLWPEVRKSLARDVANGKAATVPEAFAKRKAAGKIDERCYAPSTAPTDDPQTEAGETPRPNGNGHAVPAERDDTLDVGVPAPAKLSRKERFAAAIAKLPLPPEPIDVLKPKQDHVQKKLRDIGADDEPAPADCDAQDDPREIADDDPCAPWNVDLYGGMTPAGAKASWLGSQEGKRAVAAFEAAARGEPEPMRKGEPGAADYRRDVFDNDAGYYGDPRGDFPHVGEPAVVPKNYRPVALDEVEVPKTAAWLIGRLIPARGLVVVFGPPKSGKSFLTAHMALQIARCESYGGREVNGGDAIYGAGEGQTGFKRRLVAQRRHAGVEGQNVPLHMIENVPDLGSAKTDVHEFLRQIKQYQTEKGIGQVRAIVLDTLARCMNEGHESDARDMGRFVDRCALIEKELGCVVIVIHHSGKDTSKGGRGSNALNGAADVVIAVEKKDGYSVARIEEMKDGPEGQEWRFSLRQVILPEAPDAPTCVVELHGDIATEQSGVSSNGGKISPRGQKHFEALECVLIGDDVTSVRGQKAVSENQWWAELVRRRLIDPLDKPTSSRTLFNKHRRELIEANRIVCENDKVWLR